jgi:hypothetical protein
MQSWNKFLNTEVAVWGLVHHVIRISKSISLFPDMEGNNGRHCTIDKILQGIDKFSNVLCHEES